MPWFHTSGGGIERVLPSAGKQYDALKKRTMDKTLESTLKAKINTKLSTCDDKGAYCGEFVAINLASDSGEKLDA